MGKYYEEPNIIISYFLEEEIVRTSTGKDPFDDSYEDFGD